MDELVVVGGISEQVDPVLGHLLPIGEAEVLAHRVSKLIELDGGWGGGRHEAAPGSWFLRARTNLPHGRGTGRRGLAYLWQGRGVFPLSGWPCSLSAFRRKTENAGCAQTCFLWRRSRPEKAKGETEPRL